MIRRNHNPRISVVVPIYNEEECIPALIERTTRVLASLTDRYEIIFVDGCSHDGSFQLITEAAQKNPSIKGIFLSRNSGHQAALTCGLQAAAGDVVITMDGDLQHPPEMIPTLVDLWRQGYQIVNTAKRTTESISLSKRLSAWFFYRVYNWISEVPVTPRSSDFRLMDRQCVDAINSMGEYFKFHRALIHYIGFRQTVVEFDCPARLAGEAKYRFRNLLRLAADGIFSFSTLPLKVPFYLGVLVLFVVCLLFVVASVLVYTGHLDLPPGWGYLFTVMVLTFGVQLLFIGIMGLYIARIFIEVKGRPPHFIWQLVGFSSAVPKSVGVFAFDSAKAGERDLRAGS